MGRGRNECKTPVTHLGSRAPGPHCKYEQLHETAWTMKGVRSRVQIFQELNFGAYHQQVSPQHLVRESLRMMRI